MKKQLWQVSALAPPSGGTLPLPLLPQSLTVASRLLEGRSRVRQFGGGRPRGDGRVRVQALGHLVADEVDQALEGLLHVDVVLGAGLKELETFGRRRQSRLLAIARCRKPRVCGCIWNESRNKQFEF